MAQTDDIFPAEVPEKYQKHVNRLRAFLQDTTELNELLEGQESTDLDLYRAIIDTWQEINFSFEPTTLFYDTIEAIPNWGVLQLGATLQILVSKGILSGRNMISYNDSGGVQVKDTDTYGRYMALFNMLISKYHRQAQAMKRGTNMDGAYGGVYSPYNDINM